MRNFVSPHVHLQSLDTGTTIDAFAKREKELGTGYLVCTDHGTLGASRQVANAAKKEGLSPIIGCEFYLRDDNCPILTADGIQKGADGTFRDYIKYAHVTAHFMDNDAFECASRLLSKADDRAERHGSEAKPLFSWDDLEELGGHNTSFCSSCLIGIVGRFIVAHNRPDLAIKYYEKLRGITKPGNFYVEVFPHRCTHYWEHGVFLSFADGTQRKFHTGKNLRTTEGEIKADELAKAFPKYGREVQLLSIKNWSKWDDLSEPLTITGVNLIEEFLQNECRVWAPTGDYQLGVNQFVMRLAQKYGDKILISDDAHFAYESEKPIQDIRLTASGGSWKFHNSYHRQTSADAFEYFSSALGISEARFEEWVDNSHEWASKFKDFKFKKRVSLPTKFYPNNTIAHTMELVKRHGRMDWKNPQYVQRLKAEIDLLHKNGTIDLLPYFFVDEEVIRFYSDNEELTGPGRGSAAGLLLTYLLGITHVDPLKYELSMDRFLTIDRIQSGKLPDIDIDLPNRDLLVGEDGKGGWLQERFGDHAVQVSVDLTLKVKSAIKDVARSAFGKVPPEIEEMTKKMAMPPQGISDRDYVFGYKGSDGQWIPGALEQDPVLKRYSEAYPDQWENVQKLLGLVRGRGRHASAYLVCNESISDFIPLTSVSDIKCTQFTANSAEEAGALKYDFLCVNSLNDISECIKILQAKFGKPTGGTINGKWVPAFRQIPIAGSDQWADIWDLPEDQKVFADICESNTETVFQFNTPAAKQWLKFFDRVNPETGNKALDSIEDLAAFTALDRPGPLNAMMDAPDGTQHNMLVEYARRAANGHKVDAEFPVLDELLPETYGIIVYQEQLTKVFREIGKSTAIEAENFRMHISKKQMAKVIEDKQIFMRGAVETVGADRAESIWHTMETFGQYGFNKSVHEDTIIISKDGPKKISEFVPGDIVLSVSQQGELVETEVINLHDHGELEGFEIEFDDGYKVTCSINHKFLTNHGMKPLHEILEKGYEVLSYGELGDGVRG